MAFHVALDGCYYRGRARAREPEVCDDGHCLTQSKGLYVCGGGLAAETREAEVGLPLGLPCFDVGSSIDLKVEFGQVSLPKGIGHGWGV